MEFAKQTLKQKDGKSRLFAVSSGARLGSGTFGIGVRNDHKQLTSSLIIMMPDEEQRTAKGNGWFVVACADDLLELAASIAKGSKHFLDEAIQTDSTTVL